MKDHPSFSCEAHYTEDGNLYNVEFRWQAISDEDKWSESCSTLGIMAAPKEITHPGVYIQYDVGVSDKGEPIEPPSTVTVRDGIEITAKGTKNGDKALTFENSTGWYQVSSSWGNSIEDMIPLLDWLWEHPIDFDRFPMEKGDHYVHSYYNFDEPDESGEKPLKIQDQFLLYIPGIEEKGYHISAISNVQKNGNPYSSEIYYEAAGRPQIHWSIDRAADYEGDVKKLPDMEALTFAMVKAVTEEGGSLDFVCNQAMSACCSLIYESISSII